MFKKINFRKIIINHLSTFKNDNTKKSEFDDYFVFLIIPILITIILIFLKLYLNTNGINIIISTLAILVGLLFNVIVIIFDIIKRDNQSRIKNELLKQLFNNIIYSILISIFTIIFALITYIDFCIIKIIFNAIVYFLLTNFVLTIFMILKRMFFLFNNEIDTNLKEK